MVGRDGVAPPEPFDNRFTVCSAPTYGISSQTSGLWRLYATSTPCMLSISLTFYLG